MHIPDGFLTAPVWATLDAVSLPAVGWIARRAQRTDASLKLDDRDVPLMGVMGAFVFAAQMINFPVAPGTSGHLAGGALLGLVLGPGPAVVVMTAVLALQALIFQDGGVLALGANVFNMGLAGVAAGILPSVLLGRTRAAIFLGGLLSILATAGLALGELWISGVPVPAALWIWTLGVFLAAGVMEGVLTVAATSAIERLRPGRDVLLKPAPIAQVRAVRPGAIPARRMPWAIAAVSVAIVAGGVLIASPEPDGLQKLAEQLRLEESPAWLGAPLADYRIPALELSAATSVSSVPDIFAAWPGKFFAGLLGMLLTVAATFTIFAAAGLGQRRAPSRELPE